jgi:hypothetical protein
MQGIPVSAKAGISAFILHIQKQKKWDERIRQTTNVDVDAVSY